MDSINAIFPNQALNIEYLRDRVGVGRGPLLGLCCLFVGGKDESAAGGEIYMSGVLYFS